MSHLVPGVVVKVRCIVTAVDDTAVTANVRVIDNNDTPVTAAVTLAQGLLEVVEPIVAVNDVLEENSTGVTAVVRWVSADLRQWSPSASGSPTRSRLGWRKIGTCTIT